MAPCKICGRKEAMPYKCSYCHEIFCADHSLPEKHNCSAIAINKRPIVAMKTLIIPSESEPEYKPWMLPPTPGVDAVLDVAIRDELLRLQTCYPGCADYVTLVLAKPESINTPNWLACAVREGERILLNENNWTRPFSMITRDARDIIIHEFGHFIYWKLLPSEVIEWQDVWDDYNKADFITSKNKMDDRRYAFKNAQEGFAEAFAAYEGFQYTTVNTTDPLYFECKKLVVKHKSVEQG